MRICAACEFEDSTVTWQRAIQTKYDTIRKKCLGCAEKLTDSQLNLSHETTNRKVAASTHKSAMTHVGTVL